MSSIELTIQNAIEALGLGSTYPVKSTSGYYTCPECGKPKKLNINFSKDVYHCPRCDFGGSAFDFWAYYREIDNSGTREDFCNRVASDWRSFTGNAQEIRKIKNKVKCVPKSNELPIESVAVRNAAYMAFLDELILTDEHRESLRARGLDDETIDKNGYRTFPAIDTRQMCHRLLSQGVKLEGVPGFYKETGEWAFVKYGSGFLIPSRDYSGRIHGLQLRRDKVKKDSPRYLTISTGEKSFGAKGTTTPHFNPGSSEKGEIILTEGPLKADIISFYTGYPTLAVLGVNSLSYLDRILPLLRKAGHRKIYIAYDMDMYDNRNVEAAYMKLKHILTTHAFTFATLCWDIRDGKGLDDFLHSRK